jgi:hypothetical protein
MIYVYLDDLRPCPRGFVLARNAEEFMLLLEYESVGIASLDHDLGWNVPNGLEVARRMVELQRFPQEIYLHSSNPSGRASMYQLLYNHKPEGTKLYMTPMPEELLLRIGGESNRN